MLTCAAVCCRMLCAGAGVVGEAKGGGAQSHFRLPQDHVTSDSKLIRPTRLFLTGHIYVCIRIT